MGEGGSWWWLLARRDGAAHNGEDRVARRWHMTTEVKMGDLRGDERGGSGDCCG